MNKIKLISLLAAAAVMTGSVAMAETYSATGNGYHGEMTVNVTIEDGKITDVELGDNHETNVVIDRAFPVIRERILEANTADVDSVTAATFSSYAIKTAVADAMQQAGLEAPKVAMQNAEKTATERAAESCDIVIVGGGPAGLAAAVSAKQTNADKNVILVEKLDILSGNGKFDMNFFDMINTEAQKAAGNDEWVGEAGLAKFIDSDAASYFSRRFSINSAIYATVLLFSSNGRSWLFSTLSRIVSGFAVRRTTFPFFFISVTLHSRMATPPPQETTVLVFSCNSTKSFVSRSLKYNSPCFSKISEMLILSLSAIT